VGGAPALVSSSVEHRTPRALELGEVSDQPVYPFNLPSAIRSWLSSSTALKAKGTHLSIRPSNFGRVEAKPMSILSFFERFELNRGSDAKWSEKRIAAGVVTVKTMT
jgi:hypothetical protein